MAGANVLYVLTFGFNNVSSGASGRTAHAKNVEKLLNIRERQHTFFEAYNNSKKVSHNNSERISTSMTR